MRGKRSRQWFDVLVRLAEADKPLSDNELMGLTGHKLDTVASVMQDLVDEGLVQGGAVTPSGLRALDPYRVRRAVFLAAGFGSRMTPVTLNTPKPLVRVHGRRLIDSAIDACLSAGIDEIYIVRGYLGEQFDQLLSKYPMLKFLENPVYGEANNISSALCAGHLLRNAYVLEADLLIRNPAIVTKYHYATNFLGIPKERSDDWCFSVRDGVIEDLKIGGTDCYQAVGVSYWDNEAGSKLEKHIGLAYGSPTGKEKYWEQVPFQDFSEEYHVEIRECRDEDIVEIDTFEELRAIDNAYDTGA